MNVVCIFEQNHQRYMILLVDGKPKTYGLQVSALFAVKTRVFLSYFVHDCIWKQFSGYYSPQFYLKLIYLTILVNLRNQRSKFGIESLDQVQFSLGRFIQQDKVSFSQNLTVFNNGAVNKYVKSKGKHCRQSWFIIF